MDTHLDGFMSLDKQQNPSQISFDSSSMNVIDFRKTQPKSSDDGKRDIFILLNAAEPNAANIEQGKQKRYRYIVF